MNIFLHMIDFRQDGQSEQVTQPHEVVQYGHQYNTNEGSEFLDDAIRIHDQLLSESDY
jgi:hypothetical protein